MTDTTTRPTDAQPAARPRLRQRYDAEVRGALKDELQLGNVMQVPRFEKIVINMGVGAAVGQPSLLEGAQTDLATISGQKPIHGPLISRPTPIAASDMARTGLSRCSMSMSLSRLASSAQSQDRPRSPARPMSSIFGPGAPAGERPA